MNLCHNRCSFIAGDAAKALADLDRATELNPKDVQSYVKKASVHMELGQFFPCLLFLTNATEPSHTCAAMNGCYRPA